MALIGKRKGVRGQKKGYCKWCKRENYLMRALFVKLLCVRNGKPIYEFIRIGWLFERCGHVEIDRDKYKKLYEDYVKAHEIKKNKSINGMAEVME